MTRTIRNDLDIEEKGELVNSSASPATQKQHEGPWRSCCLETSPRAVVFISQMVFAFAVLAFSGVMLVIADGDCDRSAAYIGLISFLLGKLLSSVTN